MIQTQLNNDDCDSGLSCIMVRGRSSDTILDACVPRLVKTGGSVYMCFSALKHGARDLCRRDPIDRMLQYFVSTFRPDAIEDPYSLAITGGRGGARLTHSHER